jgi:WD40 repeat protein
MGKLKQDLVRCPITALEFYTSTGDNQLYILSGEDGWLKVYSTRNQRRLCKELRIFGEQSIHGISVSSTGDLLIWGGPSLTIVSAESMELVIHGKGAIIELYEATACDWVYDARLSPHDGQRGVILTAHNEVVPFTVESTTEWSAKRGDVQRLRPVWGQRLYTSRPILYSARVEWTAPDEALVVAGTVFGEIVVWKCSMGQVPNLEELFVLTGHEGSIFGVAISPEVELVPGSGQKQRLLASCSDDRTIRIWDITERPREEHTTTEQKERVEEEMRETGFGGNNVAETPGTITRSDSADRCLAMAIGHASRIWHVKFASDEGTAADQIEVYSFGEDTSVQKWRLTSTKATGSTASTPALNNNTTNPYKLEHLEKTVCHSGKHIWSCAIGSDSQGRTCVASGGADGKLNLLRSETASAAVNGAEIGAHNAVFVLDDLMQSISGPTEGHVEDRDGAKPPMKSKKDGFLRYAFLCEDRLLVSTVSGRLLLGQLQAGPSWSEVTASTEIQNDLKGYNVLKTVAPGTAIVGSTSGRLYVFSEAQGLEEIAQLPGKISDVFRIPSSVVEDFLEELRILVTVLGSTEATIMTLGVQKDKLSPKGTSSLALHMGFVVTAVGVCGTLLLLGSRKGVISLYKDVNDSYVYQTSRNDCKTKGGDALTSIVTLPGLNGTQSKYVLTTCRDGIYRIYEIQSSEAGYSYHLRHETAPPLGPMLEGAELTRSEEGELELIILGFRSTNFVVWNETRQQEIANVPCGGAHRTFDYFSNPSDANKLRFVYTKASAMGIFSQDEPSTQVVHPGGHGREIRAVTSGGDWTHSHGLIATGAEDTCIRIWERIDDSTGAVADLRCRAVLQKHTSGLQALKWEGMGYLLSSAGAEEFCVWKVTHLESEYKGLAVVCEAVFPLRTPAGDLRIMDFDSDLVVLRQGDNDVAYGINITMVFSNSVVKTYRYSQTDGFQCLRAAKYTGACLTQVKHVEYADAPQASTIITGSTDGMVTVWASTDPEDGKEDESGYQIACSARCHDNSVKSLELAGPYADSNYDVYTSGDDNAIAIHPLVLRMGEAGRIEARQLRATRVKSGHAAAITGLKILRYDRPDGAYIATVSNDQRVKVWRVWDKSTIGPLGVALVHNAYSAIADPGGLEIIDEGKLMIAGVGMEIWDVGAVFVSPNTATSL